MSDGNARDGNASGHHAPSGAGMDAEPTLYAATLAPYRSLDERGFLIVMALVASVSFVCGVSFLLMGAWPVFGVFGLDVLLIWAAFRLNFRAARAREEITVTPSLTTVRKVAPDGSARDAAMNTLWTRLQLDRHEEFGLQKVVLLSRGQPVEVGGFLHPEAREEMADGLAGAFAAARRGIVRSEL